MDHKPFHGSKLQALAALATLILLGGCSGSQATFATTTSTTVTAEKAVLTESEQAEARRIMRETLQATGASPLPPTTGLRWSDVPAAVALAAAEQAMAVRSAAYLAGGEPVESLLDADTAIFDLTTVDDQPARIVVHRIDSDEVYEAQANVGLFEDQRSRADSLLAALDRVMRELGAKRSIREE